MGDPWLGRGIGKGSRDRERGKEGKVKVGVCMSVQARVQVHVCMCMCVEWEGGRGGDRRVLLKFLLRKGVNHIFPSFLRPNEV